MSRQNSVLKVKGKLDDVSYYKSGSKLLARKGDGPAKSKIKTSPVFQRTRENMSEFGGAIVASKSFRMAFTGAKTMMDGRISNRLMSLFKQVMNRDLDSFRGERSVLLSLHSDVFEGFNFNAKESFTNTCTVAYNASMNAARNEGVIKIAEFIPGMEAVFPEGATHCKLVQAMGIFSNHVFNGPEQKYLPVNKALNGTGMVRRSGLIPREAIVQDISLELAFAGAPVIGVENTVIQCLGIEFYQSKGSREYFLAQNNAMMVVNAQ